MDMESEGELVRFFEGTEKSMQQEMMSTDRMAMTDNACDDLLTYGIWNANTKFKNFIRKCLLGKQIAPEDRIFWPTGIIADALWRSRNDAAPTLQNKIDESLYAYFERWVKKGSPVFYLDDLLSGETFLGIYEEYIDNKLSNGIINKKNEAVYKNAIDKLAEYVLTYPTDEIGSLPYRPSQGTGHIYVDSIGLACPFLYEYGRFNKKSEYMELAIKQIANFLAYGIDVATGLPYHGFDVATGTNGYFSWQLQALEGPADTSATAMICLSLSEGIKRQFLKGKNYGKILDLGIRAIRKSIKNGRVYDCSGECEGFSQYPQRYGDYPWALAPTLQILDVSIGELDDGFKMYRLTPET